MFFFNLHSTSGFNLIVCFSLPEIQFGIWKSNCALMSQSIVISGSRSIPIETGSLCVAQLAVCYFKMCREKIPNMDLKIKSFQIAPREPANRLAGEYGICIKWGYCISEAAHLEGECKLLSFLWVFIAYFPLWHSHYLKWVQTHDLSIWSSTMQ